MSDTPTVNPQLIAMAAESLAKEASTRKQAFVPGGDPAMTGDPAAAGGAPPMDPSMMDPAAMGGGAPPAPPAGGGGGGADPSVIAQAVVQAMQAAGMGGGGAAGGAGGAGGLKPKIDVNVEIMQMKKLLARLCDAMGVQIPAAEMTATPDDLNQMAAQQQQPGAAGGQPSAIQPPAPIDPMQAAAPAAGGEKAGRDVGSGFNGDFDTSGLEAMGSRAHAIATIQGRGRQ